MSDATGRTGFRVTHTKPVGERRAIVHEMMRELDPKAVEYWARENTNIVVEDEVLDRAFVNDGTGKFVRATSMQQVLDYGQSRVDRLSSPLREDKPDKKGKMRGGTVTTSMFVAHLPKSMCREVPDFYGKGRSRWIARDRDEAQRYFTDVVRFLGNNVVPGGFGAILGFDIQHSETTPHIQLLADTFADDPKHEGNLRPEWSRAYAAHRDVRGEDGKMVTGREKLERYQDDLKAYMVERGWPVEREVDALRHDKTATKATYGALRDERRDLDEKREQLKADREELIRDGEDLEREEYRVSLARKQVEKDRATARDEGRHEGYEQGHEEGLAQGRAEVQRLQQAAREQALRAQTAAQEAEQHLVSVKTARPLSGEQARRFFADGVELFASSLVKEINDPAVKALIEAKRQVYLTFAKSSGFGEQMKSMTTYKDPVRERDLKRHEHRQRRVEHNVRDVVANLAPSDGQDTEREGDGYSL
ncbi:hypothetical protein HMPREF9241_01636 [Schaalia turicensis ACS-279-V-Col4]|uniref:Uncharacterized protein n=1 Tax=Schaalia turicensis ACS-279-V-Col4 TaxID=883077 RepID=K0YNR5_9ACTO|nr:hypothetical protein [Schaalia turicensis]EJZ85056.1 hypothetical protein HMPREF9241_01636 [Schaalia turicensis ACS-279-V-Col4]